MKQNPSTRREDLLGATIEYMLENGVADLSLRPLAARVGSKARLLIYHFGSKENLIAEAMMVVRERVQKAFAAIAEGSPERTPAAIMRAFWEWATSRQHQSYLRLFFEVHGLALQKPRHYGRYMEGAVSSWVEMMAQVLPEHLPRSKRQALASLAVGAMDGLLLDYLTSGDRKRVSGAIDLLANNFGALISHAK